MLYHIWPNKANDYWRWNVAQLLHSIDQFDGVRSIGVVTDQGTATLQEVQTEFAHVRIDNWVELTNNPARRECITFLPLMQTLPREQNNITWYGHAKGVRHAQPEIPLLWAYAMYCLTLDNPNKVLAVLQKFGIAGTFKRHDQFRLPHHACWHYSGTFFWFRNYEVFNTPGWNDLAPNFFAGVEAWPARVFADDKAGCIFGDRLGNLYSKATWLGLKDQLAELGVAVNLHPDNAPAYRLRRHQ